MPKLTSEEYHREMYARSLDTIRVHNPTDADFVSWYDRMGPKRQKVLVPHCRRDIGKGKGSEDLPRYLAERFAKTMIVKMITDKATKEWDAVKDNYRVEERNTFEQRLALRTNNPKLWKEYFPKVWLGITEKYGGETLPDPKPTEPKKGDMLQDISKELGLADKMYEEKDSSDLPNPAK